MKKVLIVGAGIPIGAHITKMMFEKANKDTIHLTKENMEGVTNTVFPKAERLGKYLIEPMPKFEETKFYDKPKSKYHK